MTKLGLIDWGIGGIGVYREIKNSLGAVDTIYFSDTGATPYGKMDRKDLAQRLDKVIAFLISQGVDHIVIACNAASTAIDELKDQNVVVSGVIKPAIELVTNLRPTKLGLIAGRRTVVSGAYRKPFRQRDLALKQRIAQPLSAMIERGDINSSELHSAVKRILAPLKNCSHILLACTHYPAISKVIKQYVSDDTQLIDPAAAVLDLVKGWNIKASKSDTFFTTGEISAMQNSAKLAFDIEIKKVEKIEL